MKLQTRVVLGILVSVAVGCGAARDAKKDKEAPSDDDEQVVEDVAEIANDEELADESVELQITDAMEALADTNSSGESSSLALAGTREVTYDRSCTQDGNDVRVAIAASVDRHSERTLPRRIIKYDVAGSATIDRRWSKSVDGQAVALGCEGSHADIDWSQNQTGLSLDVEIDRNRVGECKFCLFYLTKGG